MTYHPVLVGSRWREQVGQRMVLQGRVCGALGVPSHAALLGGEAAADLAVPSAQLTLPSMAQLLLSRWEALSDLAQHKTKEQDLEEEGETV